MTEPVVKIVTVSATPEHAFEVFTANIARWWPGQPHSVSARDGKAPRDIIFEARPGGAIYEIAHDGARHDWGKIREWAPGHSFTMTWHPGSDAAMATHLSLEFAADSDGCRVTLTHSGWEALADRAEDIRDQYFTGWDYVLGTCFTGAI